MAAYRMDVHASRSARAATPATTRCCASLRAPCTAVAPDAIGGPVSILEASRTIIFAFGEAGACALIVDLHSAMGHLAPDQRRAAHAYSADPRRRRHARNVRRLSTCRSTTRTSSRLPLLLGVGVAFKIYYIMAWREGQTNLLQSVLTRAVMFCAGDHRNRVWQPVLLKPPGHVEHGRAAGAVADLHARGGRPVPADPDGQAAHSVDERQPPLLRVADQQSRAGSGLIDLGFNAPRCARCGTRRGRDRTGGWPASERGFHRRVELRIVGVRQPDQV